MISINDKGFDAATRAVGLPIDSSAKVPAGQLVMQVLQAYLSAADADKAARDREFEEQRERAVRGSTALFSYPYPTRFGG